MEVQQAFTCCGFNDKYEQDHPKMGHPSCDLIKVCGNWLPRMFTNYLFTDEMLHEC